DAAERLLTLLGVDEDNEDLLSSSEDEGVELDELEDDEDELENTRLLHQLAASLAAELKQSNQKDSPTTRLQSRSIPWDRMDLETSYLEHDCLQDEDSNETTMSYHSGEVNEKYQRPSSSTSYNKEYGLTGSYECLDHRLRMNGELENIRTDQDLVPASWGAGWDACATEALRYLVEEEGLPPHHPTVLAMKDHLETQRERVFAQYTA
ncbi:hypothetical protein WN55_04702, partial [Dufourea novaeangliae]